MARAAVPRIVSLLFLPVETSGMSLRAVIPVHGYPQTSHVNRLRACHINLGVPRSGLGIEAQRHALAQFAQTEGFEVAREFVEVETGKGADALDRRPQLKAALAVARKLKCHVAVAKLDRLSRDVHFISGLMAHKGALPGRGAWPRRRPVRL